MTQTSTSKLTPDQKKSDYELFLDDCLRLQKSTGQRIIPNRVHKRVAVVGAGMAGLTAAWVLQMYGYDVTIFEASNRVGGRVRTLRECFTPELYVEAGAMRVPSVHTLTVKLINEFELGMLPFTEDIQHTFVYFNGKPEKMNRYLAGEANFGSRFLPGRVGSTLLDQCLQPLRPVLTFPQDNSQYQMLTKISLGDYLRSYMRGEPNPVTGSPIDLTRHKLSAEDIELILLEESRANMEASVMEVLRDHEAHTCVEKFQIEGGMDGLPNAFITKQFIDSNTIFFNARVLNIDDKGHEDFSIDYENTATLRIATESSFKRVILAAPFSSLCHVRIKKFEKNDDGYAKLRAIRSLHYENATKIALEFDRKFWLDCDMIHGGRSITDLPIRWVHYPSKDQYSGTHGIILASYTWGEDSLRWSALTKKARLRYAYANIRQLHEAAFSNKRYGEIRLVAGMSYSWAEDSYSLGAFAIFPPHQEEFFTEIWKECGGIHFAGEHTSLRHAWIEGAVESGLRAAQEVLSALS
jgi:monoamine oxidase